ncbi:hypothetical protein WN943_009577 [Citrus x changshan-huyou]
MRRRCFGNSEGSEIFEEIMVIEFVGYRFHISYDLVIIQVVRDQDTTFASDHPTIATLFATYSANDIARSNYGPQSKTLRKLFLGKMISNASLDACYGLRKQENPLWVDASMLALGDEGTNLRAELKYKLVEIILLMKISNVSLDGCYGLRKQEVKNSIWDFYNNNTIGKPIDIGELSVSTLSVRVLGIFRFLGSEIRNSNIGHWRKDCPKAQKRDGKKPAAANMARKDEGSDYSLSITPAAYMASSSEWILDTGATYHLCHIKEWFTDFRNLESGAVVMGNDQHCHTMGIGTIRLKMFDGMVRELKEVRFVPALKKNLIFVGALEAKGFKVTIEDGTMKFTLGAMVILQGVRRHNLYYLKGGTTDEANVVEAHSDTTKLWHVRLGHSGEKSLQTLMRHGLLKGTKTCKLNFCEHCVVSKKTRVKFGTANHDTREILEYVHSDVWGPTKTASIGGSHYFVTFVDDFSKRVWVYTMRVKDEVLEIFVKWKKLVETQTGRKIKQNGVAKRMNRTFLEKVRCMLSNAGLDKKFWAEAVSYASHLINRLPSAAIGGKTLMEMWSGKHAQDYDSLRIFECPAYYHVKDGKLDPRARKAIFVGFKGGVKGFKLWDLED